VVRGRVEVCALSALCALCVEVCALRAIRIGGRDKERFFRSRKNDRRAAPILFGPRTPHGKPGRVGRTWGTRPISSDSPIASGLSDYLWSSVD
jgi:hypothetical protein